MKMMMRIKKTKPPKSSPLKGDLKKYEPRTVGKRRKINNNRKDTSCNKQRKINL